MLHAACKTLLSIFQGFYNLGKFFINLCKCRGNDVDSSLHANKWKRRIDRNKFKRPMKAYPGIDITEWNYFDAESSSTTMRRSKSNLAQLSHAAMAQYSKNIKKLTSSRRSPSVVDSNLSERHDDLIGSTKDYDKEWKELSTQNDKFHEKINKLNRTVNTLSKNMERLSKKIDQGQSSRTSSAKSSFISFFEARIGWKYTPEFCS